MRLTLGLIIAGSCLAGAVPGDGAAARPRHHRHLAAPPPSQDAIELATLAPPTRVSTIEQTYGDAAYARARLERRIAREDDANLATAVEHGGVPYPCEPRYAGTSAYVCDAVRPARSYGQGYAFTPSYLSAPQRFAVPADVETPILPPFTALSWAANSLRYALHN